MAAQHVVAICATGGATIFSLLCWIAQPAVRLCTACRVAQDRFAI